MKLATKISELAREARDRGNTEAYNAYMIALLYIEDYLHEKKEKEKKEQLEREENALELANMLVELYENRPNNTNK